MGQQTEAGAQLRQQALDRPWLEQVQQFQDQGQRVAVGETVLSDAGQ